MPTPSAHTIARVVLAGLLATTACAQATTGSSVHEERVTEIPDWVEWGESPGAVRSLKDIEVKETPLDVPVDAAWQRVGRAYTSLKLPITVVDTARHVIGAQNARVRNQLAGDRVSRWLSCGVTLSGSPRADSYTVLLTVLTQVRASGSGSVARSVVAGYAQPSDGSTNAVPCSSTGELEQRLHEALSAP